MHWFTSDLHLFDDRFKLFGRYFRSVQEQNTTIIDNINEVVKEDDILWVLGDVYLGYDDDASKELGRIKCKNRILIRGNYDTDQKMPTLKNHFRKIVDEFDGEINGLNVYMNHFPIKCPSSKFSLTGHIHEKWKIRKNLINVGVDANHFYPLSFDDILFYKDAMENHYDENVFVS